MTLHHSLNFEGMTLVAKILEEDALPNRRTLLMNLVAERSIPNQEALCGRPGERNLLDRSKRGSVVAATKAWKGRCLLPAHYAGFVALRAVEGSDVITLIDEPPKNRRALYRVS